MFSVTTYLTEKGVTEYAQVLELNFALLALLRSTFLLPHTRAELDALWGGASNLPVVAADAAEHVRKLWIEQQKLAEMRFRFQEQSEPIDYAEGLSEELLLQPDDRVLTASALFFDYDPELIRGIIALLTPDTARIDFMDSSFEPLANETEEWFGIRFSRTPVAAETLQRWWKPDVVLQKEMQLPALNAYIPEDFTLKGLAAGVVPVPAQVSKVDRVSSSTSQRPAKGKAKGKKGAAASKVLHPEDNVQLVEQYLPIVRFEMSPPAMVMDSQFGRLWHKLDTLFETPRATICVLFQSPVAYGTPARAAEHALFISLLSEALTELSYPAGLAQLHYSLSNHRFGTELRVSGFNDKLFVLARGILDRLVTYDVFHHGAASAESDPFVFCKERLIRALKNENASPLVYANSLRLLMLQCGIVMPEEFLRAAQKVDRCVAYAICISTPILLSNAFRSPVRISCDFSEKCTAECLSKCLSMAMCWKAKHGSPSTKCSPGELAYECWSKSLVY